MADNFKKYKKAKLVLTKLVTQFYDTSYKVEEASVLKIKYDERDIPSNLEYIRCVTHGYTPEGLYIWKILDLKKPIYTLHEIWEIAEKIRNEQSDKNEDYYRKYLILCMASLSIIQNNYKYTITKEDAEKIGLQYDEIDEYEGKVECLDHLYESAGESAWSLFGFEKAIIPESLVYNKEEEIRKKLLRIDL